MPGRSTEAAGRPKRIVDSRKTVGRVTRQAKSKEQGQASGPNTSGNHTNDQPTNTEQEEPTTVVLEMIDTEGNFPNHPIFVGKFLREKGFYNFTEITKLGKFRYKIDTGAEAELRRIKLVDANLIVYVPKNKNTTITFIKGVPISFEEAEMKLNIEAEHPVTQVQRIKRRDRNGELQDTTNIKVTVDGPQVPKWVKIFGCNFRPELYIFPIRQCKNCWRFGHGAKFCTAQSRCATCGGKHPSSDCKTDAKCPNCKLKHGANDPECPERQRHMKIRETMRTKQISFSQAETHYPKLQNHFNLLGNLENEDDTFPSLAQTNSGNGQTNRSFEGLRNRRQQNNSRSRETSHERSGSTPPMETSGEQRAEPSIACSRCYENPFKSTDFERFIAWLQHKFFEETRPKRRLRALYELQQKIVQRVHLANSELDRDQLLIEISQDIQMIIEEHSQEETPRTNTNQQSGV
ncbi:uncharacterized protein LOC134222240 [Armigeres subalbatus]|uniref:uncharacterized protein LOC134222240 n=1 Tax=Armigeres subalbatus TaxID=124917 RepID=UPI002ED3F8EB